MAVLKVTISEELVINGNDLGTQNVFTDANITFADRRVMTLSSPTTHGIVNFASKVQAGTYEDATIEYLRITNLSTSIGVVLEVRGNGEQYFVDLEPTCSFILSNNFMDAYDNVTPQVFSTANIDSISGTAKSGTALIEYFIAG